MRIVYMGTPDFAVAPLKRILEEGHEVVLVVTQPDKPKDRGKKIQPTPVKELAIQYKIPVAQPDTLKENDLFQKQLMQLVPDLIVVVAYGKLLPAEFLSIPQYGCINIHGSLLPRHRGAAPIQKAILDGDRETGITLMYLSLEMDAGDMIANRTTLIGDKTAGDLHKELSIMGADLLVETLPDILRGKAPRVAQNATLATYAPPLKKEDGHLDFSKPAYEVKRQIQAMNPWPGAYTLYKGGTMKFLSAKKVISKQDSNQPGLIVSCDRDGLGIKTRDGVIIIDRIKMPGKREMEVSEYIKGNEIEIGVRLE